MRDGSAPGAGWWDDAGMSGSIWFTADTHFCHPMVAKLRGFVTGIEHDLAVIASWNAVVQPDDVVWHLGDVGLGREAAVLACVDQLNGTKHLITGNHDKVWPGHRDSHKHQRVWLEHFASVQSFARRRIGEHQVMLSHFPYSGDHTEEDRGAQYRLRDLGAWLLHGHTHGKERITLPAFLNDEHGGDPRWGGHMLHVGLDAWELTPVPLHVVEREIRAADAMRIPA